MIVLIAAVLGYPAWMFGRFLNNPDKHIPRLRLHLHRPHLVVPTPTRIRAWWLPDPTTLYHPRHSRIRLAPLSE